MVTLFILVYVFIRFTENFRSQFQMSITPNKFKDTDYIVYK